MNRSICIVEYKVQQTEFFIQRMNECGFNMFAVQCYTDAFANAARTITFSLQAVAGKIPGFEDWYSEKQKALKDNRLAQFFKDYRNVSSKIGDTCVRGGLFSTGPSGERIRKYYFGPIPDLPFVPSSTVFDACADHFATLLELVYDSMLEFKYDLDDRWYFTYTNFHRQGKTIKDALVELGFPETWLSVPESLSEEDMWRTLRHTQTVGCQINGEFSHYLGKTIDGPDD